MKPRIDEGENRFGVVDVEIYCDACGDDWGAACGDIWGVDDPEWTCKWKRPADSPSGP
jgi:hypothetical protein